MLQGIYTVCVIAGDLTREFFLLPSHVYIVAEEFSNGLEVHYIWLTRLHGASSSPNHPKLITSRFLPVILSAELVSKIPYVCLGRFKGEQLYLETTR